VQTTVAPPPRPRPAAPTGPSIFRRSLSPPLFLGIVAALLLAFVGSIFAIKRKNVTVPKVDVATEAKVRRERQLREDTDRLIAAQRIDEAYAKLEELHKLAPTSTYAMTKLQQLALIRQQRMMTNQQATEASQKFDEGVALFNARKYDDAVKAFDASFRLNPARPETVNYLKLSQDQADRARVEAAARAAARQQQMPPQVVQRPTPPPLPQPVVNNTPAQITTTFNHSFTDGTIVVKIGADVVAREPLWQLTRVWHRREPRPINVTSPLTPKNADVEITINVPALSLQDRHVIPRQVFPPGSARQLVVSFDKTSKQFAYKLN